METAPVKGRLTTPIPVIDAMEPDAREQMYRLMAQAYGLYSAWWDRYIPSLIPGGVIKRRVRRRIAEIEVDDFAIVRDGGVGKMDSEEVVRACEERGIDVLRREEKELREELRKYLEWRKSTDFKAAEKGGDNGVQM
ncbi:hypothetical protein N7G274_007823 [Stereocaulon virgatum]|uniref:Letm1 RBD domain-containing protein n=1 Tax=Stereocaulon virgatum TaxID=373712 RepID=A0ABR4A2M6_9LECA